MSSLRALNNTFGPAVLQKNEKLNGRLHIFKDFPCKEKAFAQANHSQEVVRVKCMNYIEMQIILGKIEWLIHCYKRV